MACQQQLMYSNRYHIKTEPFFFFNRDDKRGMNKPIVIRLKMLQGTINQQHSAYPNSVIMVLNRQTLMVLPQFALKSLEHSQWDLCQSCQKNKRGLAMLS